MYVCICLYDIIIFIGGGKLFLNTARVNRTEARRGEDERTQAQGGGRLAPSMTHIPRCPPPASSWGQGSSSWSRLGVWGSPVAAARGCVTRRGSRWPWLSPKPRFAKWFVVCLPLSHWSGLSRAPSGDQPFNHGQAITEEDGCIQNYTQLALWLTLSCIGFAMLDISFVTVARYSLLRFEQLVKLWSVTI